MPTTPSIHPPTAADDGTKTAAATRTRRRTSLTARGEPMVWLTGGCVAAAVLMILLLLGFVFVNGVRTFWPAPVAQIQTTDGRTVIGQPARHDTFTAEGGDEIGRTLFKVGNYDVSGEDFVWLDDPKIANTGFPRWAMTVERQAWGNAYGILEAVIVDGERFEGGDAAWSKFKELHRPMRKVVAQLDRLEKEGIGGASRRLDDMRLELRGVEMKHGKGSQEFLSFEQSLEARRKTEMDRIDELRVQAEALRTDAARARIVIRTSGGQVVPADRTHPDEPLLISQVVRAFPANTLSLGQKIGIYFSRWGEYLFSQPREANTEGGVFPAIIGTVLLTMVMVIFVVPIGVIAAMYLREYAKQGPLVSIIRICVNNLAGVPSIVFGVFGLGFFCYLIGGSIDQIFFAEKLPDPTVGKSAMIWASLTLALLTLPVVIVATEEALAAVPRSMREGAYACGASKWQTIRRIVLPRAMPGVMTGAILAIARGAGEVAPLMLVGAVKLAPELPISTEAPFFGSNRSFMHLGFHIYDLGFQSRNSEAARSMVYTTTLLLIAIVVALNLAAIFLRSRLRKTYQGGQF